MSTIHTPIIALVIGVLYLVFAGLMFVKRDLVKQGLAAFPRHAILGKVLAFIAVAWFGYLIFEMNFGRFERARPAVYIGLPYFYWCLIRYLDELLSVRALGGILILGAAPLLDAIRWHESSWRLAITIFIYVMIVKGMVFVAAPYRFRHGVEWMFKTAGRQKICAGLAGALGVLFVVLGVAVL